VKEGRGSEWEVRVSECPGDPEVAAVHKEIYGARKGSTSQGV